jgi:hypothetical protein
MISVYTSFRSKYLMQIQMIQRPMPGQLTVDAHMPQRLISLCASDLRSAVAGRRGDFSSD